MKTDIEKQYSATAYDIAETAFSYFKNGELAQYAELAEGCTNGTVSEEEIKAASYKATGTRKSGRHLTV